VLHEPARRRSNVEPRRSSRSWLGVRWRQEEPDCLRRRRRRRRREGQGRVEARADKAAELSLGKDAKVHIHGAAPQRCLHLRRESREAARETLQGQGRHLARVWPRKDPAAHGQEPQDAAPRAHELKEDVRVRRRERRHRLGPRGGPPPPEVGPHGVYHVQLRAIRGPHVGVVLCGPHGVDGGDHIRRELR